MKALLMNNKFSCFLILILFMIITIFMATNELAVAQEEEYYQEFEENYEEPAYDEPVYDEPLDDGEYQSEDYQDPDPEFMEEVEPGEYDQSDNVTEMEPDYN